MRLSSAGYLKWHKTILLPKRNNTSIYDTGPNKIHQRESRNKTEIGTINGAKNRDVIK